MNLAHLLTRRLCGRLLAGAAASALFRRGAAADTAALDRLSWEALPGGDSGPQRQYRATAQILLLGLPLVRWPNVGGGSAVWRESSEPRAGVLRYLEFTGFSHPERAAGLNRLGFIREISRAAGSGGPESLYFGLMTASPEETPEEARKALNPKNKEAAYTAIDGRLAGGSVETVVAHFTAPAHWSVANRKELIQLARAALSMTPPRPPEAEGRDSAIHSFLETLADALRQPGKQDARFAYAGRFYRLTLESAPDPKVAAVFRARGLIAANTSVVRASGKVRRDAGGKESTFRLWVPEGTAQSIPLRIEYQARSYLRLIFDAEA